MSKKIIPPDWITEEAVVIFNEVVDALGVHGIPSDSSIIADYAQAMAEMIILEREVRFEGSTLVSAIGNIYINPKVNVLTSRRKDAERHRLSLGLTPRQRGVKITAKSESALDKAMRK